MNWLTKILSFEKTDWRLVKVHITVYYNQLKPAHPAYIVNDPNNNRTDEEYSYYLYENQFGDRKFEVIDTDKGDMDIKELPKDSFIYRNQDYRKIIRPWLDGAYDPEIPSYESIKAKEFKDALMGKKT